MSTTQTAQSRRATRTTAASGLSDMVGKQHRPLKNPPQLGARQIVLDDVDGPRRRTVQKRPTPTMSVHKKMDDELSTMQRSSPMAESAARFHEVQYHAGLLVRSYRTSSGPSFGGLPQIRSSWIFFVISIALTILLWSWLAAPPQTNFSAWNGGAMQTLTGEAPAQSSEQAKLPQLATPPGQHSLVGAPSVTAAQIDKVLAQFGSPAAGTGELWVKLGKQYQIDPAYALAFFVHESSAGTNPNWAGLKGGGATTHNVGNIICAGYATCYGRFRDYPDWQTGIADWYRLIHDEYVQGRNVHTLEQIIPIYAPSVENNVPAYVQAVTNLINSWKQ